MLEDLLEALFDPQTWWDRGLLKVVTWGVSFWAWLAQLILRGVLNWALEYA